MSRYFMGKGREEGLCFDLGFLGAIHPLRLYSEVLGDPRNNLLSDQKLHAFKKLQPDHFMLSYAEGF